MCKWLTMILTLTLLLALVLGGCGGKDEPAPQEQDGGTAGGAVHDVTPEQRQIWQDQGRDPNPPDLVNEDGTRG